MVGGDCVGRETELAEIAARIKADTRSLTIRGEPGVGKSTILRHISGPGGRPIRFARASAWESNIPGSVLQQLFPDALAEQLTAGAHPTALADAIASDIGSATKSLGSPDFGTQVIVVDDAEHADLLSMQTLISLIRRHRALPVFLVLAADTSSDIMRDLDADEIRLTGLDTDAVAQIARTRGHTMHPTMALRLTSHTGGHPGDVVALLDELPTETWNQPDVELPAPRRRIDDAAARLERCSIGAQVLVYAVAILDSDETVSSAVTLADISDPLPAIDDAVAAGLLDRPIDAASGVTTLRLRGALMRAAVLGTRGVDDAARAHRRAAAIVTDPVRRLHHRVAATAVEDPELADELDALAEARGTEGAWAQAATLLRHAARLSSDPLLREERLTRAVDALLAAGDCVRATSLVPTVESLRETPLRNATLAYLAILRGRATEAQVRLDRAEAIVNVEREAHIAAVIAQRRVLDSLVRGDAARLVDQADMAISLAVPGSSAEIESSAIRGLGLAFSGREAEAMADYARLSDTIRHGAQAQRITMARGWLALGLDDVDTARSLLETAVSMSQLGGSDRITLWSLGWLARARFLTGEWDLALTAVRQGMALAESSGMSLITPILSWTAAQISALRGDWAAAHEATTSADPAAGSYEMMRVPTLLARAAVAEASADYGRVERLLATVRVAATRADALRHNGFWPWTDVLANAMVIGGRSDAADELLSEYEAITHPEDNRAAVARLRYARGRWHGSVGDIVTAQRTFDEALDLLDGLGLRYDQARVNFSYGQTLRRAGKRRAADTVISSARDLYASLGATTYVERCDRELKAGGINMARGQRDTIDLTPQEEAVTTLVARGLSNREVAAELFISTKTVQYHLTRIYAKLGVRSRTELAADARIHR